MNYTERISERNRLRYEIRLKKNKYSKMVQHPEQLEETLILKSEIESLEAEYQKLQ